MKLEGGVGERNKRKKGKKGKSKDKGNKSKNEGKLALSCLPI